MHSAVKEKLYTVCTGWKYLRRVDMCQPRSNNADDVRLYHKPLNLRKQKGSTPHRFLTRWDSAHGMACIEIQMAMLLRSEHGLRLRSPMSQR